MEIRHAGDVAMDAIIARVLEIEHNYRGMYIYVHT